jgi:hypothetical protein
MEANPEANTKVGMATSGATYNAATYRLRNRFAISEIRSAFASLKEMRRSARRENASPSGSVDISEPENVLERRGFPF